MLNFALGVLAAVALAVYKPEAFAAVKAFILRVVNRAKSR